MRGKVGLVIGLGIGYVLGTRAGRERYEQIKEQALKVWNLDPVQNQVGKAKDFAKSSIMALPNALWDGATRVAKAASQASRDSAPDVKRAARTTVDEVAKAVDDKLD